MTIIELRDKLIERGIEEVKQVYEAGSYKLEGALQGFQICRNLGTPEEYQKILDDRRSKETKMAHPRTIPINEYWKYRYATLQIEFVYERLKIAWNIQPFSARAVMDYAKIVGVAETN